MIVEVSADAASAAQAGIRPIDPIYQLEDVDS